MAPVLHANAHPRRLTCCYLSLPRVNYESIDVESDKKAMLHIAPHVSPLKHRPYDPHQQQQQQRCGAQADLRGASTGLA